MTAYVDFTNVVKMSHETMQPFLKNVFTRVCDGKIAIENLTCIFSNNRFRII